jgi:uncharacterized SAM-binding protein YcdF (DUF218 family)
MFFALSKILGFFVHPSNVIFALAFIGILLMATRFARLGRALAVTAILLLATVGFLPVGNMLIHPLEQRFPAYRHEGPAPAGIVVLGGAINPDGSAARGTPMLNESSERLTAIAELARRYPQARIVYSGGSANLLAAGPDEATFAKPLLESFGIAPERILLERRSRSTYENAVFSRDLVKPKEGERWLIVTSAHHMPRSIGVFRAAGFAVEPYPVDWRVSGRTDDLVTPYNLMSDGLKRADTAMHEWIGLAGYFIAGKTSELFPGPR